MFPDIWLMRLTGHRLTIIEAKRCDQTVGPRGGIIVPRLQRNSFAAGSRSGYHWGRTIRTGGESGHFLDTNRVHDRG